MATGEDSQVYRDLMRFKPEGLSPNAWAVKAGVNRTVWADMRRHGNPSRKTLEKLLVAAGSSLAEFEALRIGGSGANGAVLAGEGGGESRRRAWTRQAPSNRNSLVPAMRRPVRARRSRSFPAPC